MAGDGGGCSAGHGDIMDVLWSVLFLFAIWASGQAIGRLGLPPLAGEIIAGMLLGPQLADIVPHPDALMLFGEFGLFLMVIEAGFEIELQTLRQIGGRAVGASIVGMLCGAAPLAFGIAKALGLPTSEALAVGASLAPCSTGVALVVLKRKRAVNTPTGQLIVATAFAEDIIALILLSELKALANPTGVSLITPIGVSLAFAVAVGGLAIKAIPYVLSRWVLPIVPPQLVEPALLLMLFGMAGCLMAALNAGGASPLMGAFLAGLSFCTIRSVEHVWKAQVKRLQTWLVRIFFACTVGFDVPVMMFGSPIVWKRAIVFWCATLAKMMAGIFAVPLKAPQALTLGLAMASLGEFSFIVGTSARNELKLMTEETYASVTLAVLFTIFISPTLMGMTLSWSQRRAEAQIKLAAQAAASPGGVCYYKLDIKVLNRWGLVGDILRLLASCDVEVIEFRLDLRGEFALYEAYLKDNKLRAPTPGDLAFPELASRLMTLRMGLMGILTHDPRAAVADENGEDGLNGDGEYNDSMQTVNFAALRGLRLERWMPGAGPEEWDEAGLVGNEEQATTIMRREQERSTRSVMDIFGAALPGKPNLSRVSTVMEKEEKDSDEERPDADALLATPLTDTRRAALAATSMETGPLLRRPSGELTRRGSLDAEPSPLQRATSLDAGPRTSVAGASPLHRTSSVPTSPPLARTSSAPVHASSLGAAMAAMAAHLQSAASSPPDYTGRFADETEAPSPLQAEGFEGMLSEAASVDEVVARARGRASTYRMQQQEEEDAHGLLGIVRRHRPRGLRAPAPRAVSPSEVDAAHEAQGGSDAGDAPPSMTPRIIPYQDEQYE